MICFHTESGLELDMKNNTAIDHSKQAFHRAVNQGAGHKRRWVWIMDAVADEQPTQNESTEDWMRHERMDSGREGGEGRGVGGVQEGNGAAACSVAMITNRRTNNVILLP